MPDDPDDGEQWEPIGEFDPRTGQPLGPVMPFRPWQPIDEFLRRR